MKVSFRQNSRRGTFKPDLLETLDLQVIPRKGESVMLTNPEYPEYGPRLWVVEDVEWFVRESIVTLWMTTK